MPHTDGTARYTPIFQFDTRFCSVMNKYLELVIRFLCIADITYIFPLKGEEKSNLSFQG